MSATDKNASAAETTRESWLNALVSAFRPLFAAQDTPLPDKIHVSVGFPSKGALSKKKRRIGECWATSVSADGNHHVFIHPMLDTADVAHVMLHECVHAGAGLKAGHRGPFKRLATALGLTGKMTATVPGDALKAQLLAITSALGPYPHAVLDPASLPDRKAGRMLLMICRCDDKRPIRVSRAQAEKGGYFCQLCESSWELPGVERDETDAPDADAKIEAAVAAMRKLSLTELGDALVSLQVSGGNVFAKKGA